MIQLKGIFGSRKEYSVGIVLSGGGARGYSHAGALKAMEEVDLAPDIVSGVSAGSIVGAMYAAGMTAGEMFDFFSEQESIFDIVRINLPKKGLFKVTGLEEKLRKIFKNKKIEDLEKKLIITATNISKPGVEYFESGEIVPRVLASSAIPVLFNPVEIGGQTYVDGGMLDNLPVAPILGKCGKIIGVSLNPIKEEQEFSNLWAIAERTFRITVSSQIKDKLDQCDLVIAPEELGEYGLFQTGKGKEMFDIGYQSAKEVLKSWNK